MVLYFILYQAPEIVFWLNLGFLLIVIRVIDPTITGLLNPVTRHLLVWGCLYSIEQLSVDTLERSD